MGGGQSLYELIGGDAVIRRLVEAFYPIVRQNPVIGGLFPDDLRPLMEKQRRFLTQFFGGPPLYSELYGHPRMRARHLPFPVTRESADAWLDCMRRALEAIGMEPELARIVLERLSGPAYHFVNR